MKKTILRTMMAFTIIFSVACKNDAKTTHNEEDGLKKTEESGPTSKKEKLSDIPRFSDNDVQQYISAYEKYMEEYRNAVENKDMTAFAALGTKGQELATMGQGIAEKLSIDEVKKYAAYMTAKAEEIQDLSAKITQ